MKKRNIELVTSGLLFICSVIIYFLIIPREVGHGGFHGLSPALFPRISTSIIGVLSGLIFLRTLSKDSLEKFPLTKGELSSVLIFIAGSAAYIYGIKYVGYYISTTVASIGFMLYLGVRKWRVLILLTLILEVCLYLLFEKGLRLTMPRGFLF